jgi:hypothetical protein
MMFEKDFISRLIRRRAIALLKIPEDQSADTSKFISTFYGYRSTIAHGDPLSDDALSDIRGRMEALEILVRAVMVAALEVIPAADDARRVKLTELASVTEEDRIEHLVMLAKGLKGEERRKGVLNALQE